MLCLLQLLVASASRQGRPARHHLVVLVASQPLSSCSGHLKQYLALLHRSRQQRSSAAMCSLISLHPCLVDQQQLRQAAIHLHSSHSSSTTTQPEVQAHLALAARCMPHNGAPSWLVCLNSSSQVVVQAGRRSSSNSRPGLPALQQQQQFPISRSRWAAASHQQEAAAAALLQGHLARVAGVCSSHTPASSNSSNQHTNSLSLMQSSRLLLVLLRLCSRPCRMLVRAASAHRCAGMQAASSRQRQSSHRCVGLVYVGWPDRVVLACCARATVHRSATQLHYWRAFAHTYVDPLVLSVLLTVCCCCVVLHTSRVSLLWPHLPRTLMTPTPCSAHCTTTGVFVWMCVSVSTASTPLRLQTPRFCMPVVSVKFRLHHCPCCSTVFDMRLPVMLCHAVL